MSKKNNIIKSNNEAGGFWYSHRISSACSLERKYTHKPNTMSSMHSQNLRVAVLIVTIGMAVAQNTSVPTPSPSVGPTSTQNTSVPTSSPPGVPTSNTSVPTSSPSVVPTSNTSVPISDTPVPTSSPTLTPSTTPSFHPSATPSFHPSSIPSMSTSVPTLSPTTHPTCDGNSSNTTDCTWSPTTTPSVHPSISPLASTTLSPSLSPTVSPTSQPTTSQPTSSPTVSPTVSPTTTPSTSEPTSSPTISPTSTPTTSQPTSSPTTSPTTSPTCDGDSNSTNCTWSPTAPPTTPPSTSPTTSPTCDVNDTDLDCTMAPTSSPTVGPTLSPTTHPSTSSPTDSPSSMPSESPSHSPTNSPSVTPTSSPTQSPTVEPTLSPTLSPTQSPTLSPTTSLPTLSPTRSPTIAPTLSPTTSSPTVSPSLSPTTSQPTTSPTTSPTTAPSKSPTMPYQVLCRNCRAGGGGCRNELGFCTRVTAGACPGTSLYLQQNWENCIASDVTTSLYCVARDSRSKGMQMVGLGHKACTGLYNFGYRNMYEFRAYDQPKRGRSKWCMSSNVTKVGHQARSSFTPANDDGSCPWDNAFSHLIESGNWPVAADGSVPISSLALAPIQRSIYLPDVAQKSLCVWTKDRVTDVSIVLRCDEDANVVFPGIAWTNTSKMISVLDHCDAGKTSTSWDNADCEDLDECLFDTPCAGKTSSCHNTLGSFECKCGVGYNNGGGTVCSNVDECGNNEDNCDTQAVCFDQPGSFSCVCKFGFTGDGTVCDDIEECVDGDDNDCDDDASCSETPGSFVCTCNVGFSGEGTTSTCVDIDECPSDPCPSDATCANTIGSYTCSCDRGYTTLDNGITCTDVDECGVDDGGGVGGDNDCHNESACSNNKGSFSCGCNAGYSGSGVVCSNINECSLPGSCMSFQYSFCIDNVGSFECPCSEGYARGGQTQCKNINECLGENTCDDDIDGGGRRGGTCVDVGGSYRCDCTKGWFDASDFNPGFCGNVNECDSTELNPTPVNATYKGCSFYTLRDCHDCPAEATCVNSVPVKLPTTGYSDGFTCECNPGYTIELGACVDLNECVHDTDTCVGLAACQNNLGSFACLCQSGYSLQSDEISCGDVDECFMDMDTCDSNEVCNNIVGSFECVCSQGYAYGAGVVCRDLNECTTDPCGDNAVCTNTEGSFTCACTTGYNAAVGGGGGGGGGGDGFSCVDKNECVMLVEPCPSTSSACHNTNGSFSCVCAQGWTDGEESDECVNINECTTTTINDCDVDTTTCQDTTGSYECECRGGFTVLDAITCVDVLECDRTPSPCQHTCVELFGSYTCECDTGYALASDTHTCNDEDECVQTPKPCANGATCVNNGGSFACSCVNGWSGDKCDVDVNECDGGHTCNPITASCKNSMGSYTCECRQGFQTVTQGPFGNCGDRNECDESSQACVGPYEDIPVKCINTFGSYACECLDNRYVLAVGGRHNGTCITRSPTHHPTHSPTVSPTVSPTITPTTSVPSVSPTLSPSTTSPTTSPTISPSVSPTTSPTITPTTSVPTVSPTVSPTVTPSISPSLSPTITPTTSPSLSTTASPSVPPTSHPSASPTTTAPTHTPTSSSPSMSPTPYGYTYPPTVAPTTLPTLTPTLTPTTSTPTTSPSSSPSVTLPTQTPSAFVNPALTSASGSSEKDESGFGMIIGGAAAGLILLILLIVGVVHLRQHFKRKRELEREMKAIQKRSYSVTNATFDSRALVQDTTINTDTNNTNANANTNTETNAIVSPEDEQWDIVTDTVQHTAQPGLFSPTSGRPMSQYYDEPESMESFISQQQSHGSTLHTLVEDETSENDVSLFKEAILDQDEAEIRRLADTIDRDVLWDDEGGVGPLHIAAASDLDQSVALLCQLGFSVELKCSSPSPMYRCGNALHIATANSHSKALQEMVLYCGNAAFYATNSEGYTPLDIAHDGHFTEAEQVVDSIAVLELLDLDEMHSFTFESLTRTQIIQANQATPTKRIQLLFTALHNNNAAMVAYLHDKCEVDLNARDTNGLTPLHVAASTSSVDAARALCSKGASCETLAPATLRNPLHIAAANSNAAMLKVLVQHCGYAAVCRKDFKHQTPLEIALQTKDHACIAVLRCDTH